jgi:hypothetical protein
MRASFRCPPCLRTDGAPNPHKDEVCGTGRREWRRVLNRDAADSALTTVRRAMERAGPRTPDQPGEPLAAGLRELHRRLAGLHALGGAYAAVEPSPYLEGLWRATGLEAIANHPTR